MTLEELLVVRRFFALSVIRRCPILHAAILAIAAAAMLPHAATAASFTGLGELTTVHDISADGWTVVGDDGSRMIDGRFAQEAFFWQGGEKTYLGVLPGQTYSLALGVSDDGSVIVGKSTGVGFRWENGAMESLADYLPPWIGPSSGRQDDSQASAVSDDGSVIVGRYYFRHEDTSKQVTHGYRLEDGVFTPLGALPDGLNESGAYDVSADGSVIVGKSGLAAFRWEAGVMTKVFPDASPYASSGAYGVNADGSVLVGAVEGRDAFRWENGNAVKLGFLSGETASAASGVSADGSIVVGSSGADRAFMWDSANGMRDLKDVLTNDFGLDLAGWRLFLGGDVVVSADGKVIAGTGRNPNNQREGWVARLIDEYQWTKADGGAFHGDGHWTPRGVPGARERARVDLEGQYVITAEEDIEVDRFIVGGGAGRAQAKLALNNRRMQTRELIVDTRGTLNLDGRSADARIEVDFVHVGSGTTMYGDAWLRPRAGGALTVEIEGILSLGQEGRASPQRTLFVRGAAGPEPAEFYAHMAVRGDFDLQRDAFLSVTLDEHKAYNQGADSGDAPPLPSAELLVTGSAKLNGTLAVSLAPGYRPKHGDSFSIVRGQLAAGFDSAKVYMPTAHNGLPLVPIQTATGVHAVVPQKVVLAWGHDLPVSLDPIEVLGVTLFDENPLGTEDAFVPAPADAAAFETYKAAMLSRVRDHYLFSGVEGVVFDVGPPEEDAINVYFIDPADAPYPTLLGTAYTGIDPMNREAAGDAAVFVRAFKPGNPADVELDAETVVHEVGHLLGLRHIDPPGTMAIMDYDEVSGDFELFTDRPFPIKEKPKAGGTEFGVTHNPLYHLRRYVDGVPHQDLVDARILPGTWDLPGVDFGILDARFSFRLEDGAGAPPEDLTLYNVLVYKTEGDPSEGIDVLSRFAEITLAELADQIFRITAGDGLGLLGASILGGDYDVSLALGNPFESDSLVLYPGLGQVEGFLHKEDAGPSGFVTLAGVSVTVVAVPEPTALGLLLLALALRAVPGCGRRR